MAADRRQIAFRLSSYRLQDLLAAEGQQLAGQGGGALAGLLDRLELLAQRVGRVGDPAQREIGVAQDRGQQVVEIVGDPAGQPPDRLHLLGLARADSPAGSVPRTRGARATRSATEAANACSSADQRRGSPVWEWLITPSSRPPARTGAASREGHVGKTERMADQLGGAGIVFRVRRGDQPLVVERGEEDRQ